MQVCAAQRNVPAELMVHLMHAVLSTTGGWLAAVPR